MWSDKWPDGPGWFWFFGWVSKMARAGFQPHEPETILVRVVQGGNSLAFITEGRFIYKRAVIYKRTVAGEPDAVGLWMPAELPDPPDQDRFNDWVDGLALTA